MIKRILMLFLIVLLLVAAAGGILWMIFIRGYPWWTGVAVAVGLCGILLGVVFLRRYAQRRTEQEFVERVITQDEEAIKALPDSDKPHLFELQEKWKESVELLRGSYLRKRGNPLYVLPWYLILGESGSGKTSAIKNTKLNSPIGETPLSAGISVTRNCDWWFFEEAIILDTAGRYTIPIDESRDREEWEKFLALLAEYRRREPVNGILVTIAADKLLEMNEARLSDEGQNVRKRIDQLMRILGASIPVYVLVTKIDLIPGVLEFTNLLPAGDRGQAMGFVNCDLDAGWKRVLAEGVDTVGHHLRELQFILANRGGETEPEMFLFLHGFDRLKPALELYAQALFSPQPYEPTPPFRGIFFSSAIQEGKAQPGFSGFFDNEEGERREVVHNNGLFLRDLFQSILPHDRGVFNPIPEFLRPRRSSLSLGLVSWLLVWACVCGLAAFSWYNARSALHAATPAAAGPKRLTGHPAADFVPIVRLGDTVARVERINRRWIFPWLGFHQGKKAEQRLKAEYVRLFREGILRPFDAVLLEDLKPAPEDSTGEARLNAFGCLLARIELLREFDRRDKEQTLQRFGDAAGTLLSRRDALLSPGVAAQFGDAYLYYLTWSGSPQEREKELAILRSILAGQLADRQDLRWVALNWIEEPDDIRLSDFWGDLAGRGEGDQSAVPGIFTRASVGQLQEFFGVLKAAAEAKIAREEERDFWEWYETQYYDSWNAFLLDFNQDGGMIVSLPGGRQKIAEMSSEANPYFLLLERLGEELRELPGVTTRPSWAALAVELDDLRKKVTADSARAGTVLGKLSQQKDKMVRSAAGKADKRREAELKRLEVAGRIWSEYLRILEQLSSQALSPEACFAAVSQYTNASLRPSTPFAAAADRVKRMRTLLGYDDAPLVWGLVSGPPRFLLEYGAAETALILQQRWDRDVLSAIRGIDPEKIPQVLFDQKEGLVWKFITDCAKPFVAGGSGGWTALHTPEAPVSIRDEFIEFLNNGPKSILTYEPSYTVTLETLPVESNREAAVRPVGCVLSLQCAEEKSTLENYNYPKKQIFTWSPDSCGETVLSIMLPDLTLTRNYGGKLGFAGFLADFSDGSRTFTPEDFPRNRESLEKLGITFIRVSYRISGARAITRLLDRNPARVPLEIVGP
ncbi:MAG: type VI secretion protein IcmF/TssM N-terminal domain-containing protein [Candidatus Latescibacterota bacterium]